MHGQKVSQRPRCPDLAEVLRGFTWVSGAVDCRGAQIGVFGPRLSPSLGAPLGTTVCFFFMNDL
jgi:hypothetical protein